MSVIVEILPEAVFEIRLHDAQHRPWLHLQPQLGQALQQFRSRHVLETVAAENIINRLVGNTLKPGDTGDQWLDPGRYVRDHAGPKVDRQPAPGLDRIDEFAVAGPQLKDNGILRNLLLEHTSHHGLPESAAPRVL